METRFRGQKDGHKAIETDKRGKYPGNPAESLWQGNRAY